jgi:hypothetical protein
METQTIDRCHQRIGDVGDARISPMSKLRAKKIKLILFDVDGVLTDGKIWIFPPLRDSRACSSSPRNTPVPAV